MMPIADMVDHVESLCRSHEITIFYSSHLELKFISL